MASNTKAQDKGDGPGPTELARQPQPAGRGRKDRPAAAKKSAKKSAAMRAAVASATPPTQPDNGDGSGKSEI
jgi:hypothetical protein